MPFALVLSDTFGTWQRDVAKLSGWTQLIELEEALLGRVRGLFLARWFGTGLPASGGQLRIAIGNLDELGNRFRSLQAQASRGASDVSLTEPLAGIAGTMVGALLAPTSSTVVLAVVAQQLPQWVVGLAAALNFITFGGLGLVLLAVGIPVLAVGMPLGAVARREQLATLHGFLGGLGGFFKAARTFVEQLIGPRSEVRNPLMVKLLDTLDGVATVVPFLFALLAFVLEWVGPRLEGLALQLSVVIPVVSLALAIIGNTVDDLFAQLLQLVSGQRSPWAVVGTIVTGLSRWFRSLRAHFSKLYASAASAFEMVPLGDGKKEMRVSLTIRLALQDAFAKVEGLIAKTSGRWLVQRIKTIGESLAGIAEILLGIKAPPKKSSWVKNKLIGALPPLPKRPDLKKPAILTPPSPVLTYRLQKSLMVTPPPFQPQAPDTAARLKALQRSAPDPFAATRQALLAETPQSVLESRRAEEAELQRMLFAVIDNLLPASVAAEVPKLQALFWELDEILHGSAAKFPVRDLPGGDRLRLEVRQLRVRAPGSTDGSVRAWGKDLKTALEGQVYRTGRAAPT